MAIRAPDGANKAKQMQSIKIGREGGGRGEGGGLKEQVAKSGGWRRRRRVDVKQAVRLSDGKYR